MIAATAIKANEAPTVEVVLPVGADTAIANVSFSPDGRLLATASQNGGPIRVWDAASRRLIRTLFSQPGGTRFSLVFSGDGTQLVSMEPTPVAFDLRSGAKVPFVKEDITSFVRSRDGRLLAGADDRRVFIWDARTLQEIRRISLQRPSSSRTESGVPSVELDFDPSGTTLAAAFDGKIGFWEVETGKRVRAVTADPRAVFHIAHAPDGRTIAAMTAGGEVKLWTSNNGKLTLSARLINDDLFETGGMQFTSDGRFLLVSVASKLHVLNASTLKSVSMLPQSHCPSAFAVAPDRPMVACIFGSLNPGVPTATMLEVPGGRISGQLESTFRQRGIAFVPGSSKLFTGSEDGSARLWDARTGRLERAVAGAAGPLTDVSASPDGKMLATAADKLVRFWSAPDLRPLQAIKLGSMQPAVSFTRTPSMVFLENTLLNLDTGLELLTFGWTEGQFRGIELRDKAEFSADGRLVAGVSLDPAQSRSFSFALNPMVGRIADARSGKLMLTLRDPPGSIELVFFQPGDAAVVSVSTRASSVLLSTWSLASGRAIRNAEITDMQRVAVAVPMPDRQRIVLFDDNGKGAIYDVTTGARQVTLGNSPEGAETAAVSSDGRFLAAITRSSAVRIWDLSSGAILATIMAGKGDDFVVVTPEGFFDGTPGGARALTVVRGLDVYSIDQVYDQLYRPDLVREKLAGDPHGLVRDAAARMNLSAALDSGAPPRVELIAPGSEVGASRIGVEADIADLGGGIGRIEWRVNGVTSAVAVHSPAPDAQPGSSARTIRVKQEISLQPGANLIEVLAYNARGLVASTPSVARVTSTYGGMRKGRLFVLAVGINDYYDSRLALNFAVPDARSVAESFRKAKGELYESVETLILFDADVTIDRLGTTFARLGSQMGPEDTFVLFIAGHGKTVDGRYYFLPRDFRYTGPSDIVQKGIGQQQFQDWLARIPAQRSVLLFDTCESGSLTGERVAQRGLERVVAMEKMAHAMGRTTIAASTDDAPAFEGLRGHGVFTYALLRGLSEADRDGNGSIEVLELVAYIDRMVPELSERAFSRRQIPQTKFSGSNFRLATRTTGAPDQPAAAASPKVSRPMYVVVAPVDVFATVGGGVMIERLALGSLVRIVETQNGWALVERDGRRLGYLRSDALIETR